MKNDMYDLGENLFDFAFIPSVTDMINDLKLLAEDEDWTYHNTASSSAYPVLENYLMNTYRRLAIEKK